MGIMVCGLWIEGWGNAVPAGLPVRMSLGCGTTLVLRRGRPGGAWRRNSNDYVPERKGLLAALGLLQVGRGIRRAAVQLAPHQLDGVEQPRLPTRFRQRRFADVLDRSYSPSVGSDGLHGEQGLFEDWRT